MQVMVAPDDCCCGFPTETATHFVKLHHFFAGLLTDRSNEWCGRHKYPYANECLRVFLHPIMVNWGSGIEAPACVFSSIMMEIYKNRTRRASSFINLTKRYFCLCAHTVLVVNLHRVFASGI